MLYKSVLIYDSVPVIFFTPLGDGVELTRVNKPDGKVFDWLFEPMSTMKQQLTSLNLQVSEEVYMYKYCVYSGNLKRMEANGGCQPPEDEIRKAQLEGICRR